MLRRFRDTTRYLSFLGPCCPALLYCNAVHDSLMLTERINDDDDDDDENLKLFLSAHFAPSLGCPSWNFNKIFSRSHM